ncbi:MAG: hypothetical protein RBR26_07415 [Methanosarcina mazei]|jgi:hypothetical protein|nr:hypothetical protein [Methanosarcina mazei]
MLKYVLSKALLYITKKELAKATLMDSKGVMFRPFDTVKCSSLDIEVIALALSRIMRFFGQTELSVAQHCVNMARIFIHRGETELAKQALLHEVSEAFMGDLASPLKKAFPLFKEIEESLIKKTFKCHGLPYPMDSQVHILDKQIMINEAVVHMPKEGFWISLGDLLDPQEIALAGVDLTAWKSEVAFMQFMMVAEELGLLNHTKE